MSVSEQEAKQQIAQMRLALESMKASARRASYVKFFGVIIGFAIVGVYVYLFISLGAALAHSTKWVDVIKGRPEVQNLQEVVKKTATSVVPVYLKEGQKMVQSMNLQEPLMQEGSAFLKDIGPFAQDELQRELPKLQSAVIVEANQAANELEVDLQGMLQKRLEAMIQKHSAQIETETGLTEVKAAEILDSITTAAQTAILNVIQKRWGANQKKLAEIADLVDQLPALPPMSEADLLDHMRGTLIALVKIKLPDYDLEAETGKMLIPKGTVPVAPTSAVDDLESKVEGLTTGLKATGLADDQRKAMQTQLDAAKKQLEALKAAPPVVKPAPGTPAAAPAPTRAQTLQTEIDGLTNTLKQAGLTDEQRQSIQAQLDKAKKELEAAKSAPAPAAVPAPAAAKPAAAVAIPPALTKAEMLQQEIDGYTNALKQPGLTDQARQNIQALLDKAKKDMDALKSGPQ
jgi:5-bromo-4-chloroindolyl phosphate hydrolysis protein